LCCRSSSERKRFRKLKEQPVRWAALSIPVGAAGFEPATSASQTQRAGRLRHAPYTAKYTAAGVIRQRGGGPPDPTPSREVHSRRSLTSTTPPATEAGPRRPQPARRAGAEFPRRAECLPAS